MILVQHKQMPLLFISYSKEPKWYWQNINRNQSCLDPIPTWLLLLCIEYLTNMWHQCDITNQVTMPIPIPLFTQMMWNLLSLFSLSFINHILQVSQGTSVLCIFNHLYSQKYQAHTLMVKMWLQFTINLIKAPGGQNNF